MPRDANSANVPAALPGARVSLVLLLLINLFNYIDRYILASVLPKVEAELLPNDPDANFKMGLLSTAFLVSYMLAAPLFGYLADRTSRWKLIGIGVILWSLASGGSGWAMGFGFLLLMRVLIGIGEAAYGPTAPTLISDMYPVEKRGAVLAWFFMAIPVGSALGYALGGFAASHWTWHWAFLVTLPPGIALGIWALTRPEPKRGGADVSATNRHAKLSDYRTLLHTRTFVMNNLAQTAMTFAVGGIAFWMPKYIFEKLKTGTAATDDTLLAHIGTTFGAITVLAGLSATLLGGYLGDKLRTRVRGAYLQVSGWGMLACFPCFVGALYTPFPYAWGLLALAMFFLFLNTGPSNTALANVVHPSIRASAFAVNIFVIHALGDAISPAIIGKLKDSTGSFTIGFLVVSVMILVSGVLWLIGSRTLDADTSAAPTRVQS